MSTFTPTEQSELITTGILMGVVIIGIIFFMVVIGILLVFYCFMLKRKKNKPIDDSNTTSEEKNTTVFRSRVNGTTPLYNDSTNYKNSGDDNEMNNKEVLDWL